MKTLYQKFLQTTLAITGFLLILTVRCHTEDLSGWDLAEKFFQNMTPPVFPHRQFDITDFGAVGDGLQDCSEALRQAIEKCHGSGGGSVWVPAGNYLTGPIHLKSNVNLILAKEATLLFSIRTEDYLPVVYTRFEGVECMNYSPLIYAFEAENIAVTGAGLLDGQASLEHWWPWAGKPEYGSSADWPTQFEDRQQLFQMAESGLPVEERIFGAGHYLRPNFIQFYRCKNILVQDISIINSPMWEVHPVLCENVIVRNIHVKTHGPNNDGCNPESCTNVLIQNCFFDTGDDCIAIKSGRNGDGRRVNVPSQNILVRDCTMKDGHGGVVIGSEMSGGVRNVFVENCLMDSPNLERALRIKTNSLRGGTVENVYMRKVTIGEVSDAVLRINFNYEEGDTGPHTPAVRKVFLSEVTSRKSRFALALDGYERSPISQVHIQSCRFDGVLENSLYNHIQDLKLDQVYVNGELQP
ncbi:MAG: glycoside hydrolase family 28 protein [Candidatus Marinimicrobia bacterium]|nr:glycoside hydrolase family 28 protein [Candidatus Neomarinimicrobiota bacterium]